MGDRYAKVKGAAVQAAPVFAHYEVRVEKSEAWLGRVTADSQPVGGCANGTFRNRLAASGRV